jgi:polyribonucleotide nucleotidyltransferase
MSWYCRPRRLSRPSKDKLGAGLRAPYPERNALVLGLRVKMHEYFEKQLGEDEFAAVKAVYDEAFDMALHKDVRAGILSEGVRPDGRKPKEIRPLSSEVGLLPRAHGSSLFTRGVTQALNVVTLAPLSYAQMVDTMEISEPERLNQHGRYLLSLHGPDGRRRAAQSAGIWYRHGTDDRRQESCNHE